MKKLLFAVTLIGCGLLATPAAEAGVFIGVGPVYPAYRPRFYAPPPVVAAPVVVATPPVVFYGRPPFGYYGHRWHHGWR